MVITMKMKIMEMKIMEMKMKMEIMKMKIMEMKIMEMKIMEMKMKMTTSIHSEWEVSEPERGKPWDEHEGCLAYQ